MQRGGKNQQPAKPVGKARRGRVKKGKNKKTIKINGLDLLHDQTLLSTSPQGKASAVGSVLVFDPFSFQRLAKSCLPPPVA